MVTAEHVSRQERSGSFRQGLAGRARLRSTFFRGEGFRMKKLAIGCGIALLLTGMAAAGVAYYIYRQVGSTITQFAELGKVPDLERGVRNQSRFEPPASGELTDSQVARLIAVQSAVRQKLGERMR